MSRIKGQTGLSLVEVTIVLLVLMLLTSVLAPSMWDFIHDAQWVKVKEDCEAIGISFTRLTRDVGPCLRANSNFGCDRAGRVDVLYSEGAAPGGGTSGTPVNANILTGDWRTTSGNPAFNFDSMQNQFVLNTPGYSTPLVRSGGAYVFGPQFGTGWRGPYLSAPIGPDPWGSRYYVNSGFFATATDANAALEGSLASWWERDVICVTAGPNQTLETPFAGNVTFGTLRSGDDFAFVISGSGR
jgi:hypothetical protein